MDTIVVEETRGKRDMGTDAEETVTEKRVINQIVINYTDVLYI